MKMRRAILLAVVCLFLGSGSLVGMEWGVSAGADICLFRQKAVQDIYGAGFPFGIQVWSGWKNWRVSVGFEYLPERGQALPLSGGTDEYPLRLKVTSIPLVIYYRVWLKDVFLAAGGGASYSWYEEKWEDLEIITEGQKWGPLLSFLAGYRFSPRWSVLGSIRYEPVPTGKSSLLVEEVKLGGLKIGAGIMFSL